MNIEDYIKDLSPELQEEARACASTPELIALAKEHKVPLPDEALAAIAGGEGADPSNCGYDTSCPQCGSDDTVETKEDPHYDYTIKYWKCNSCGYTWTQMVFID